MSTEKKGRPAAPDFTQCPNWGKGGKFIFDPTTGQRTRVNDAATAPAWALGNAQAVLTEAEDDAGTAGADQLVIAESATPKKEKTRG